MRLSKDVTKERRRGPNEEDQTPIYQEFFESYMIHKFFTGAPPVPEDPLKNWNPRDAIDKGKQDYRQAHSFISSNIYILHTSFLFS